MEIEEIIKLRELEKENAIPPTKRRQSKSDKRLLNDLYLLNVIAHTISDEEDSQKYLKANLFEKLILRSIGIKQIKKSGNKYKIKTIYGDGIFFHSKLAFEGGETPEDIEKGLCFKNCRNYALSARKDCDVVCGLASIEDKTITHAVVERNGFVLDFNCDIGMSADLYYELLNFEELSRVSAEVLSEDYAALADYSSQQEYPYNMDWACLFAYDEYKRNIKNQQV